jgi:hypothetical protein
LFCGVSGAERSRADRGPNEIKASVTEDSRFARVGVFDDRRQEGVQHCFGKHWGEDNELALGKFEFEAQIWASAL